MFSLRQQTIAKLEYRSYCKKCIKGTKKKKIKSGVANKENTHMGMCMWTCTPRQKKKRKRDDFYRSAKG